MTHPSCRGFCQSDPRFRTKHMIPERKTPYGYLDQAKRLRSRPFIEEYRKGYRRCRECDIIFPPNPNPVVRCPCCHCLTTKMPLSSPSSHRYRKLFEKKPRPPRIIIRSDGAIKVVDVS